MLKFRANVEHASAGNLPIFISRSKSRSSPHDVIHLIFVMRPLRIDCARRKNIKPRAHPRNPQKFLVQRFPLGASRVDFAQRKKISFGFGQSCPFQFQESSASVSSPLSLLTITRTEFSPGYCPF